MKDRLKIKREERVSKQDRYEALVKLAEGRELTKEEKIEEETLTSELTEIDKDIERYERMEKSSANRAKEKINAERRAGGPEQDNAAEIKDMNNISKRYSFARVIQNVANTNDRNAIDGLEKEVYDEAKREAKEAGINLSGNIAIPGKFIQIGKKSLLDVATEGTDAVYTEYGGLIPILRPDPITVQLGITVRSGLQGNVQWTRQNGDVSYAFETESADVNETTPTLDNISVSPKRFGGYVDVTNQFMIQSPFAVEQWLREQLEARYALTVDSQVIAGDGSSNSTTGILNYSGVNVLSLGSGTTNDMTYAALLEMIRLTKIAYARNGNAGWLTNATGEFSLARTPMQSSGVEGNFIYKPDIGTLIGRRFLTSELVPSNLSEGAQSDLCGIIYSSRWQSAILATWGGLDLLFDPYTQALGGKKRFVVNAFMDVEIEQPLEFSICKDWDASDLPAIT
jgi:HK97 family phage major capsid protein